MLPRTAGLCRVLDIRMPLAVLALLSVADPAGAASVLGGAYGDRDGCRYAKSGESSGSDTFFLLNDEGVTTASASCAFAAPPRKTGESFKARMTCEAEDGAGEPEAVEIRKGSKGLTVLFGDGTTWGPLAKCR